MAKVNRTVLANEVPTITEFSAGGTVRSRTDLYVDTKGLWRYTGSVLPKLVPSGTLPSSEWTNLCDSGLRGELSSPDGWGMIGAGSTTVAGLGYVFTGISNNTIKKEELKQWVLDGLTKGITYFSVPTGTYTLESLDNTPFIVIDDVGSTGMCIIDFNGSVLTYNGTVVVDSFILINGRSAYITVRNGRLFCKSKISFGVRTSGVIGISQVQNFEVREAAVDAYQMSAWLCSFENAIAFKPARHGFYIGATAGTATSTSCLFKTCWTKAPKGHGYYLGRLTYANFLNSAYDGDGAGLDNGHAVIGFHSFVYGLTITGMGTENYGGRLLKQDGDTFGIRGLTVNNWHLFKVGVSSSPMEYLFDLQRITRATIVGISKNDSYNKRTGILRGDSSGDALIMSPDGTASDWVYSGSVGTPSYGFGTIEWSQLPIKRSLGALKVTKNVANLQELTEYLQYLRTVTIDIGVEIVLTSSVLLPSGTPPVTITGLRGGGYVKVLSNTPDTELGSREVYKPFRIVGNDCPVIFSKLTLVGWNQSGTLFYLDSAKVRVSSCRFLAHAQAGVMFEAYNGSDVIVSADCTKVGTWAPTGGFEFVLDTTSTLSKRTQTGIKWGSL